MYKMVTKNGFDVAFDAALEGALVSVIGGAPEGRCVCAPKSALQDLYKYVPEGSFKVGLKSALEVKVELHSNFHMLMHLLAQKCAENKSMNGELETSLYVALEEAPKIFF